MNSMDGFGSARGMGSVAQGDAGHLGQPGGGGGSRGRLGQVFDELMVLGGQNYIINVDQVIPANSTSSFTFDLTGISGRVQLSQLTANSNRTPPDAPFDITLASFSLERFDATRREETLIDGAPTLDEMTGDGGLPAILAARETLLARSKVIMNWQNNTGNAIRLSLTWRGFTTYALNTYIDQVSATRRGRAAQSF